MRGEKEKNKTAGEVSSSKMELRWGSPAMPLVLTCLQEKDWKALLISLLGVGSAWGSLYHTWCQAAGPRSYCEKWLTGLHPSIAHHWAVVTVNGAPRHYIFLSRPKSSSNFKGHASPPASGGVGTVWEGERNVLMRSSSTKANARDNGHFHVPGLWKNYSNNSRNNIYGKGTGKGFIIIFKYYFMIILIWWVKKLQCTNKDADKG